jgi:hypothetical protein
VDRRWIAEQVARRGLYDSVSGRPRKQRPSAVGDPALLLREIDTKSEMVKPASPVSPIQSGAVSVSPITTSNPVPTAPGPSTSVGSAPLPSHFWDRYTQLGASHRVPALPTMISSRETRVQGEMTAKTTSDHVQDRQLPLLCWLKLRTRARWPSMTDASSCIEWETLSLEVIRRNQ